MSARRSWRLIPTAAGAVVRVRLHGAWVRCLVDDFLFAIRISLETGDPSCVLAWDDPFAFGAKGGIRDAAGTIHRVDTDPDRLRGHVRAGTLPLDQGDAHYDPPAVRIPTTRGVVAFRPADRAEEAFCRAFLVAVDRWRETADDAELRPYHGRTVADSPRSYTPTYRLLTNPRKLRALIDRGELVIDHDRESEKGA